jgi:diguanylate cyclase
MDASQIGVWEHNLDTNEIVWDQQMHQLYGTGRRERVVASTVWIDAVHPEDRERAQREFDEAYAAKGRYDSQFRIVRTDGDIRHLRSKAHFFEGPGGVPSFIGAEWDITADVLLNRELAEQTLVAEARAVALERSKAHVERAADHDYLTGLPNRRYFDRRIMEIGSDPDVQTVGVVHIDLDRFKQTNDKFGHGAGDAMLQSTAKRLFELVSERDVVARIGGDEFVAVLVNFGDVDALKAAAERVLHRLREDIPFGSDVLQTSVSIGVAWDTSGATGNLLAESDLALYQAKKLGRNRVEFFTLKLQSDLQGERQLAEELKLALSRNEIVPFYQIQVDARTRHIFGLEALARWRHPVHGLLAPGAFLKVADEYGLTAEIDAAMLHLVLRDRAEWERNGVIVPRIAVNISANRLGDPDLIASLSKLHIPENAIVFELVETIFLDDSDDSVLSNIEQIKMMGIDVEIDDFGSGHASLIGLVKLRPKRLKIDRQLVFDITTSKEQLQLVASIVEIAKTLKVEVIAEGVETEDHARLLARIGCDGLQGYALGYPSPAEEIFALLRDRPSSAIAT